MTKTQNHVAQKCGKDQVMVPRSTRSKPHFTEAGQPYDLQLCRVEVKVN